jgi:hypothetical protein
MKRLGLTALFFVSACVASGPVAVVYKPGSTGEQRLTALTDCETQALSKVPRAIATGMTPAYTTPSNVQCYGTGAYVSCQQYGGQTYGGNVYSYDANQELRDRVTLQCLAQKGYQVISLPTCDAEQSKRAVSAFGRKQPTADQIECVIEGGGYVLKS